MRDMPSLFTVSKMQVGRDAFLVEGAIYAPLAKRLEPWGTIHKGRHAADLMADRMTAAIIDQAHDENARFDRARSYLAMRKARPVPAQGDLFTADPFKRWWPDLVETVCDREPRGATL